MTKYLISFPGAAMQLDESEFEAAGRDAHAVIQQMKDAGAYVFGGGIDEDAASVMVALTDPDVTLRRRTATASPRVPPAR